VRVLLVGWLFVIFGSVSWHFVLKTLRQKLTST